MTMEMDFAEAYRALLMRIRVYGSLDTNQRTGSKIAFLPDGWSFVIRLHDNILPTCGLRRTRPHIAAAEAAWCFMGSMSTGWLRTHTKIWDAFANNNGDVAEAYGFRWKYQFGIDQINTAIDRLKEDSSDRRIWITSYHPTWDLRQLDQKTVPCPVGFTLSMFENRLNSSFVIRSSDVLIGLPLDVMRHAMVMRAIANSIGCELGHMRILLAHPHLYENQWSNVDEMLTYDVLKVPNIKMLNSITTFKSWTVEDIVQNPDEYVQTVQDSVRMSAPWPTFDPKVEVVK